MLSIDNKISVRLAIIVDKLRLATYLYIVQKYYLSKISQI